MKIAVSTFFGLCVVFAICGCQTPREKAVTALPFTAQARLTSPSSEPDKTTSRRLGPLSPLTAEEQIYDAVFASFCLRHPRALGLRIVLDEKLLSLPHVVEAKSAGVRFGLKEPLGKAEYKIVLRFSDVKIERDEAEVSVDINWSGSGEGDVYKLRRNQEGVWRVVESFQSYIS